MMILSFTFIHRSFFKRGIVADQDDQQIGFILPSQIQEQKQKSFAAWWAERNQQQKFENHASCEMMGMVHL